MRYLPSLLVFLLASLSSVVTAESVVVLKSEITGESFPRVSESTGKYDGPFIGCSDGVGPLPVESSDSLEPSDQASYSPLNLMDNESTTCWAVRGGSGSWFALSWGDSLVGDWRLDSFSLINGYAKTPERWQQNSRIRELEVSIDGRLYGRVTLHDTPKVQTIRFPSRLNSRAREIRFTVISIYPGSYYDDLCVSEFQLEGWH